MYINIRLIFVKIFALLFSFESPKINLEFAKTSPASSRLLRYRILNPANSLWAQSEDFGYAIRVLD